ncbi:MULTISPECIES: ribosome assembly RNA-binding protein YhbY [unclassified Sporolactobacillus]|uniref:ribosome assembly RNA-binding protein YhbY n=1 Tax=unclassified Sporolactobacillus TaxID=2628533 RepID=UPI002368E46E|nr:ribosome assembly RNA-binding protein YhbY [Sporolactobacillus sp. CQH2019]MDD9147617.1 ribosome assembly RNA-binding protein YhbY [Sporolactobacillus sp. CQH2019]
MLNSRQRKFLEKKAHSLKPVFQIGKAGLHEAVFSELDDVLEKRELIKVSLLQNTTENAGEAGRRIAEKTHAELVQIIGHTLILYRESKEHKRIECPKG